MKPLEDIYKGSFFGRRHKLNWRAPIICGTIADILAPETLIDVGCATGDLVAEFVRMGVDAYGIEGSIRAEPFLECEMDRVFFEDLRRPLQIDFGLFDLVLCLEVAEHIEPEFAIQFATNLSLLGDRILMSAAPPGQGGHYHVNCREPGYWEEMFRTWRYARKQDVEQRIKAAWLPWAKKPGIKTYHQNLLYFERR